MMRHGDVTTSIEEEAASGREKGGNDASWTDVNLTSLKSESY
jgi:hypothetical protein